MIFPEGTITDFAPYGFAGATNNEMELQAVILALKQALKLEGLKGATAVTIHSDSQYVVSNVTNAMFVWPKNKWLRSTGEPVLNARQWKELIRLKQKVYQKFRITVHLNKVEAHVGHEHNEAVDRLAKNARRGPMGSKISVSNIRRRRTSKQTVRGSIRGEGQQLRIHVVETAYLPTQKVYRLRCEVLSKKSPYYGNVDFMVSEHPLSAGHVYDVKLSSDLEYCRIEKIIREVEKKEPPPCPLRPSHTSLWPLS